MTTNLAMLALALASAGAFLGGFVMGLAGAPLWLGVVVGSVLGCAILLATRDER